MHTHPFAGIRRHVSSLMVFVFTLMQVIPPGDLMTPAWACPKPTLNSATPGANQVALAWSPVGVANYYKVYYGTTSGSWGTPINVGNVTSYSVTGLNSGTKYYFAVTAVDNYGESAKSNVKDATTYSDPPVLNSATGGTNQVGLAWSASSGATSYKVYYGTSTGSYGTPVNAGNVTSYTVTGLTAGTTYYFAVTAVNAGGESAVSNELNAPTIPAAPVLNSATAGVEQVTLGWIASTGASGYKAYYGTTSGVYGTPVPAGDTTEYTVTGLTAGITYYFAVTALNTSGESAVSNELNAVPQAQQTPTAAISASPQTIASGSSTTLTWSSSNATSFFIDHGIGAVASSGSLSVQPSATTTYTFTVTGPLGSASAEVTVSVTGTPAAPEAGSFGAFYSSLIPTDSTVAGYDAKRFSVVRGEVRDASAAPLAGVAVTVLGRSGWGTAYTDSNGQFALPVEGGELIKLVYRKSGYIPSQRQIRPLANDVAVVETITMIAEDTQSTEVTLDGDPDTVVVHRSSTVTDTAGTRRASVVFTGDTEAYAVDAYGNDMFELTKLNVRATEFTTPASMPAVLPPTTSFTYCVELKADGVERARFTKPVVVWVNNFLGFDVGETVPSGYYDRDQGAWVAEANGKVVELLDTDSDGVVDALDATGDGVADDLNDNSDFSDEVKGLDDPAQYQPGQTYWRIAVDHFSVWDFNWMAFAQAGWAPAFPAPAVVDDCEPCLRDPAVEEASYVSCRSRIYHEDIDIPGTDLTLHYASDRVTDRQTVITVPVSGASLSPDLLRIKLTLEVGGRQFVQDLSAATNQVAEFVWDGLDFRGQRMGVAAAKITMSFVYAGYYFGFGADQPGAVFGLPGVYLTTVPSRGELELWTSQTVIVNNQPQVREALADGWTLSNQHYLSAFDTRTMFRGDGSMVEHDTGIISLVAGDYYEEYYGDGGPATEAYIHAPRNMTFDKLGNMYIADTDNHVVRKVDATTGIITTVAGTGSSGFSGDGGAATAATLTFPTDVAVDADGNLFIADNGNACVRRVDAATGIITTFTGIGGVSGLTLNGILRTGAYLYEPYTLEFDDSGNLYIGEDAFVVKVATNNILTVVAGTGVAGYSGDGGAGNVAQVNQVHGLAFDPAGNLYIAEYGNNRVRRVDTAGTITTVAGTGVAGYSGDYGLATAAEFSGVHGVAADRNGNIYVSDTANARVRRFTPGGPIATIAGNGYVGNDHPMGDGGPALSAVVLAPAGLTFNLQGELVIAAQGNSAIRKVTTSAFKPADPGDMTFTEPGVGYVFSHEGQHKQTVDLDTGKVLEQFTYDASDRLVSVADRFGNTVTVQRNAAGVPTGILGPYGQLTSLMVDANNHLTRITYPGGAYYTFEYSTGGLMTEETEPKGNYFTHTFDPNGRITRFEDQEGKDDTFGRVYTPGTWELTSTVTGAEGTVKTIAEKPTIGDGFDATLSISGVTNPTQVSVTPYGMTTGVTRPDGTVEYYETGLDPQNMFEYLKSLTVTTPSTLQAQLTVERAYEDTDLDETIDRITVTQTLNSSRVATAVRDLLASQYTYTSPGGRTVTATYDPVTLLTSTVSVPGVAQDTIYGYDTHGRLLSVTQGTRTASQTYDASGNLLTSTDPLGRTTTYGYDSVGRVLSITRPDTTVVYFTYDGNGNMTVLTNPASVAHNFTYDDANREKTYDPPVSGVTQSVYDNEGRLTQVEFPSTKEINNVYTGALLTQVQLAEGNVNLTYLGSGQVSSITKSGEGITYTYDGRLLTGETLTGTLAQSLSYTYDNNFDVTEFTYAGGTETLVRDADGLLVYAGPYYLDRNALNGRTEGVYDATALIIYRAFDADYGEVSGEDMYVASIPEGSWSVTRNANGQIATKSETVDGITAAYEYGYDLNGRLLTVYKDGTLVEEYRYNDPGNPGLRTYEMNVLRGIVPGRSLYYNSEDQLLSVGGTTYLYDADGYLAQKIAIGGTTTYAYSTRGELLTATLPDTRVISYVYDPLGRRIAKKINGVITEKYLWSGLTTLLAVYDGSDNLLMRFQYTDERMPYIMTVGESTYYLLYNQVGSLRAVYDSSGTIVKRIDYDSFGNVITDTAPTFTVPFGFAGGLRDVDTGLVHFGYRDYDPETGRWTAKDPIGFAGGDVDLYSYVENDTVNFIDPVGLLKETGDCPWGQCYTAEDYNKARDNLKDALKKENPNLSDCEALALANALMQEMTPFEGNDIRGLVKERNESKDPKRIKKLEDRIREIMRDINERVEHKKKKKK